jgi:hypothetical protein
MQVVTAVKPTNNFFLHVFLPDQHNVPQTDSTKRLSDISKIFHNPSRDEQNA